MRALREPEAQPACSSFEPRLPLRWPISSHRRPLGDVQYAEITLVIGGNGAGTKFGVGGHLTRSVIREAKCQIERAQIQYVRSPTRDSLRRVRREGLIAYTTPAMAFAALSIQVQVTSRRVV